MAMSPERPPYREALLVSCAVLAVYVASLAPTVTFWDAGEFIAAMKVLGIPHPPGTPLFVMLGHVWATLIPFGEYAWRTNLMSAVFSAAAGGMWFLVVHESLGAPEVLKSGRPEAGESGIPRVLGAAAAVSFSAFAFTTWQNSNETEVYGLSTFLIALTAWLSLRWRAVRGTRRAAALQLLILYLQALAVANHLLALLAGPALIGFMAFTLRAAPAAAPAERRAEWARLAVMAGTWALLLGSGLGSTGLFLLGAVAFAAALAFAATAGRASFALGALVLAIIGVSPYLFLLIRSGQHPPLNEAQPDTWQSLLSVIRREQYGIRTPFDDPTILHGPENPGRSLTIISLQVQTYLLYWVWQWGKGIGSLLGQGAVFVAMLTLGVRGSLVQRRSDRGAWWLVFLTWLITGVGLVAYMNFRPGFSIGYDQFPSPSDHEVRERDYFYIVSFVVWGLWAGIGLWDGASRVARRASRELSRSPHPAYALLLLAAAPIVLNWREASRSTGADRTLAADFAYNLLNSAPPYAVLYTYGDNDTFPLWWAQEVAGIRRDVTIVCLALAQTDWYMRQLRDAPVREFEPGAAPEIWRRRPAVRPEGPLHSMSDAEIATVAASPVMLDRDLSFPVGPLSTTLQRGRVLYPNDIASLRILQQNLGRRPIVWALTTGDAYLGLRDYVVQRGLGFELVTARPDTTGGALVGGGIGNVPFDFPITDSLAWQTYRYGSLLTGDTRRLESTSASMASSLSIPFTLLAFEYDRLGDTTKVIQNLERADRIAPNEAIESALQGVRGR
jgi:uncharacterized membrane protein YhaH (DUF805 family)